MRVFAAPAEHEHPRAIFAHRCDNTAETAFNPRHCHNLLLPAAGIAN